VTGDIRIFHGLLTLDDGTINATNLQLHGEQLIDPATNSSETGDTRVTLTGNGQINANVINGGGYVSPGLSAGILNVQGNYTQAADGTMVIELAGTDNSDPLSPQFDLLNISGLAALGGVLDVTLLDPGTGVFAPTTGSPFDILTATRGVTGEFAVENLPALSGGLSLDVVYNANSVSLDVVGILGDVNFDGSVNTDDIDALAAAANAMSTDLLFDLNGDGVVNFVANGAGESSDSDFLVRTLLGTEYGDANLDGKVGILDLDLLGQGFSGLGVGWLFGNFDGQGTTGILDLDLLGQNFGFVAAPPAALAVPEPTTCLLACFAAIGLALQRVRFTQSTQVRLGVIGLMLAVALPQQAKAVLVVNDSQGLATLTVNSAASPVPGFLTYTFSLEPLPDLTEPLQPLTEITSIDASFTAMSMRQFNPGSFQTVFTDNNGLFAAEGEDPLGDSQFLFNSFGFLIANPSESSTSLAAAFTGFAPIQSTSPIAQVVLPTGTIGTADLEIVIRDIGGTGVGQSAFFPGVSFGMVAVPEPSALLFGTLVCGVVGFGRWRRGAHRSQRLDIV
jgi:hypothetical protein